MDKEMFYLIMKDHRRKFTSKFKSKVVLEAISERETLSELALKFDLHRNQIVDWKKKFLANAHLVFELDELPLNEKMPTSQEKDKIMRDKIQTPFTPVNT